VDVVAQPGVVGAGEARRSFIPDAAEHLAEKAGKMVK
jgi:hypothetical protein